MSYAWVHWTLRLCAPFADASGGVLARSLRRSQTMKAGLTDMRSEFVSASWGKPAK